MRFGPEKTELKTSCRNSLNDFLQFSSLLFLQNVSQASSVWKEQRCDNIPSVINNLTLPPHGSSRTLNSPH